MYRKLGLVCLFLLITSRADSSKADFLGTIVSGHVDIGVGFASNRLEPHIHNHGEVPLVIYDPLSQTGTRTIDGEEFSASQLWFGIPDSAEVQRPAGAQWDFLGTAEANPVWLLLEKTSTPDRPFVGFSWEELGAGWSPVEITILGITGRPGSDQSHFSVFQTDDMDANVTSYASTTSDTNRSFTLPNQGHGHWYIAFTGEGVFDVSLNFSSTNAGTQFNEAATFTFAVGNGNFQAVPEPTSMALLACCGTMMFGVRRWRKHASAAQETVV